jgi:hypothetical protein
VLAVEDLLEGAHGVLALDEAPGVPVNCSATKNGCDRKRWILRARLHDQLVLVAQLLHAEDRDDVRRSS